MRLLVLALIAAVAPLALHAADTAPAIAHDELAKLVAAKQVVLLDANGSTSWRTGHIPGAIDFAAHGEDLAQLLPQDKGALIVAYCGGPTCQAWEKAASAVAALGYTNVKHYADGISGWKKSGAEVEAAASDAK